MVGGVETTSLGKGYFELWWLATNGPDGRNYTSGSFFYDLDSSIVAAVWDLPPRRTDKGLRTFSLSTY